MKPTRRQWHEHLLGALRQSFHFDDFTLDLGSMSLRSPRGAVDLRPKSFDVLRYLVEHAGQVASKDEVMASVWADVVVTEDSLTRCISEIRRALGDDAQTLVKTVPKRGYRLDVPVTVLSLDKARPATDVPATPSLHVEEPLVVPTVGRTRHRASSCRNFTPAHPNESAASLRDFVSGAYIVAAASEFGAPNDPVL